MAGEETTREALQNRAGGRWRAGGSPVPVLAVAGGTASGKSTLAEALALHHPDIVGLIHLDDFYVPAHDPLRGVRTLSATGAETLDWNHPGSIDEIAVAAAIDVAAGSGRHRLVVVEGLFALTLPAVAARAAWRVYVDTPDDIRLARKILRKIEVQRQDPALSLRNYLAHGRESHAEYVAPSRSRADLVLDGTAPEPDLLTAVMRLVGPVLGEPVRPESPHARGAGGTALPPARPAAIPPVRQAGISAACAGSDAVPV